MTTTIPDPEDIGKLFVGGLNSVTTKESLQSYFSQFGEVVDCVVMKNIETGRSRGFGFVTFKDPSCVYKVLQIKNHELDGKKVDPKECTPRSMQKARKQAGKCKVFMGGLPPDITEEAIREGMSKFGKVNQVVIMFDQETKKCRGFGFLSFELEESIDQACAERFVIISGKQIECKKAEPRMNPKRPAQSFAVSKNENGFIGQSPYLQLSPVEGTWNMPPVSPIYAKTVPDLHMYNSGMAAFNTSSPAYPSMQPMSYVQQYPSNYGTPVGNYIPSPVPANTYTQTAFVANAGGSSNNNAYLAENEKTYGSNSYSQSPSSYGPSKGTYIGGNTSDVAINQGISSPNYQRYHPYKV